MTLIVNGKEKTFERSLTLQTLMSQLDLQTDRKGVALCLNMQVIPKESWESTELSDGDKVEIVIAAPGG